MDSRSERESRRTAILFAVLTVIASRGLGAVSIRSVAAEAGVSVGLVQHYFDSKQELIRATAAYMIAAAEARHYNNAAPRPPGEELWEILAHALPLAEGSPAGTSVFYSLVAASVADPQIATILAQAKTGTEDAVAGLLAEVAPQVRDPRAEARHLLALSDGLTLQVLIGHLTAKQARQCLQAALAVFQRPTGPALGGRGSGVTGSSAG
ncbi:MAG TPA: TetR/AcrR family transcriptional regulator [Actinomycetota bacterium]|nr:TetR/AcrR family transcriptional regulator [Actinomycetota bacterium]